VREMMMARERKPNTQEADAGYEVLDARDFTLVLRAMCEEPYRAERFCTTAVRIDETRVLLSGPDPKGGDGHVRRVVLVPARFRVPVEEE
jgi:hypothetical protein